MAKLTKRSFGLFWIFVLMSQSVVASDDSKCEATIEAVLAKPEVMAQFDQFDTESTQLTSSALMTFSSKNGGARALRPQAEEIFNRIKLLRGEAKVETDPSKLEELKKKIEAANQELSKLLSSMDSPEMTLGADFPMHRPPGLFWTAAALDTTIDVSACTKGERRVCFHIDLLDENSQTRAKYVAFFLNPKKVEVSFDVPASIYDFSKKYLNYLASADPKASTLKSCLEVTTDEKLGEIAKGVESNRNSVPQAGASAVPGKRSQSAGKAK